MTGADDTYRRVTLHRAHSGAELWAAVETAQYGHVVQRAETGAATIAPERDFADGFAEIVEVWESASAQTQSSLIARLDAHVAALHDAGLRIHWCAVQDAIVDEDGDSVALPIAIVRIGPDDEAELEFLLPALQADDDD